MFQLFESIQVCGGVYRNLDLHQQRMHSSAKSLWGNLAPELVNVLPKIPEDLNSQRIKCRVKYNQVSIDVSFVPYVLPKIRSLKVIRVEGFNYSHKFINRTEIDLLYVTREECDDILIVNKDKITDTSFCNVVLEMPDGLFTPTAPLLIGTRRQEYLNTRRIIEKDLLIEDLKLCKGVFLINAMIGLSDKIYVPRSQIYY
jgi:4-amino-4-deoxychorismate lyase